MMMERERPTLKEIARQAGVSASTVSLVLNNRPGVGPRTRAQVKELLAEVGYERNAQGRPAAVGSGTLGFVVYDAADIEASHNPFFAEIQRGIEEEAKAQGYGLRVVYVHENDDLERAARNLRELRTSGLILDASVMPAEKLRIFLEVGTPLVIFDNAFQDVPVDGVVIDNVAGAHAAVRHLVSLGHKDIGLCSTSVASHNFVEREQAFEEILEREGLRRRPEATFRVRPTLAGAYEDARELLQRPRGLPTAFFATNDIIASGLLRAMIGAGIGVPDEVSIVGFDDLPLCELMQPQLTTIRVFKSRMAQMAVRRLIERIGSVVPETVTLRIGTELVVRASTAAPAHRPTTAQG